MTEMNTAKLARISGKKLEDKTEHLLNDHGFASMNHSDWHHEDKVLIKNVPFITMYNKKSISEFKIIDKNLGINARIECRRQKTKGSLDERFPYLFENSKKIPECHMIIVLEGDGFKKEAIEWLKFECNAFNNRNKIIRWMTLFTGPEKRIDVFSFLEFQQWVENNFNYDMIVKEEYV